MELAVSGGSTFAGSTVVVEVSIFVAKDKKRLLFLEYLNLCNHGRIFMSTFSGNHADEV